MIETESQENKKVKNAKKYPYNGIIFDSALEVNCYKLLLQHKLKFKYSLITYVIIPGFRMDRVNLFHPYSRKKKYGQELTKDNLKLKILSVKYTPDFVYEDNSYIIIIETKGHPNDVYPLKKKLFIKYMEEQAIALNKEIYFFEPHNIRQIVESINVIKKILC